MTPAIPGLARPYRRHRARARRRRAGAGLHALAYPGATTCFYMGREAATEIGCNLVAAGLDEATPVLVAVDVSLPGERLVRGTLGALPVLVHTLAAGRPTPADRG